MRTIKLKRKHKNQEAILVSAKRFNVLKCGRRFGKTALAEELVIRPALDGYPVAYYSPTYKDLADFWRIIVDLLYDVIETKNEQLKQIRLITGGVIDMWSLDEPDSGRGRKYKRVIMDECEKARKLEQAWNGTIRATLTDFVGDAWFLSTPKFGDTYFKELYHLKDNPDYAHEWQSWTYTTYDNPHILASEVDSARKTMNDLYFRCEYLAEDVDLKGMLWAFAFDDKKHVTDNPIELNKNEPVYLSFDFNKNPISCSVIQHYNRTIYVLETIKLENSDIYALCDYILSFYPNCLFIVTGDATGRNTSALVKDNLNYYTVIRNRLRLGSGQMKQPIINPPIQENQVLVNSLLANYGVQIHRAKGKALIYDLKNVKISEEGKIEKSNRADASQQADALDTFRYWCNSFMHWYLKVK